MVVVAIRISLALKLFDYSRCRLRQKHHSCGNHQLIGCGPQSGSRILPNSVTGFEQGISSTPRLANGAIIISIRASPELDAGCARPRSRSGKPLHLGWTLPRWLMTLTIVAIVFGIFAVGLIVLLIYKSTLTMHEDDQLFLDDHNSHMQEEQTELLTKVNKLVLPVRVFSIGSGIFLLVLVAMLIYQKLNEVQ
jgi:hypothetical protein